MNKRIARILEYCKGDILDIGCLQHSLKSIESESWLHGKLREKFKNVVGIDISSDVLKLRELGYEVYKANAENFDLGRKFDTIVAGELIEHLSNPGNFLECVKKHLKDDGILILTTPNPFYIEFWIQKLLGRLKVNKEHTAWFDIVVLSQLASRHGFRIREYDFIQEKHKPKTILSFIWHKIVMPILKRILPKEFTGETIFVVMEIKK